MKISRISAWIVLCLVLSTLATFAAIAQEDAVQPEQDELISKIRPGPQDEVLPIEVGIIVIDIDSIDGANQLFVANFAVIAEWKDPRLAEDINYIRVVDAEDVWTPNLQVLNQQKLFSTFPDQVQVAPDGTVTYPQRYWGTMSYPMNLEDFPLDSHLLEIRIVAVGKDRSHIDLVASTEDLGMSEVLTVTDFEVVGWKTFAKDVQITPNIPELPGVVFEFEAKRLVGFYIIKVIIPLILIVFMSLIVLFIDPSHVGPKFSISITAILTLIAYRFLLGNLLPKISYLTHMDYFLFGSMFLVFTVLVETSIVARFMSYDKVREAKTLDYWARYAFVILFLIILVGSFTVT